MFATQMQEALIKILIVEDDAIIAHSLELDLISYGYDVCACVNNYADAVQQLKTTTPDFVIIDINLNQVLNGIDIGRYIFEHLKLPFIFLTANTDNDTIAIARKVFPKAFLSKPYDIKSLIGTIQVAIYNHTNEQNNIYKAEESDFHFVKVGNNYKRVNWKEVSHIEVQNGFSKIYTTNDDTQINFIVKISLDKLYTELRRFKFERISRSVIVNTNFIKSYKIDEVLLINEMRIAIGEQYKKNLDTHFNLLK
jgi:DNA-binding LytR/AlgR family response regulator